MPIKGHFSCDSLGRCSMMINDAYQVITKPTKIIIYLWLFGVFFPLHVVFLFFLSDWMLTVTKDEEFLPFWPFLSIRFDSIRFNSHCDIRPTTHCDTTTLFTPIYPLPLFSYFPFLFLLFLMSWSKKVGGSVAKAAVAAVRPTPTMTGPPGSEPIGGRYRVWNFNLPPNKAVAVSEDRQSTGHGLRAEVGAAKERFSDRPFTIESTSNPLNYPPRNAMSGNTRDEHCIHFHGAR